MGRRPTSPRILFLLADDPGAVETIMAGLLIEELKIRGLAKRMLIVAPANLCCQWQRENPRARWRFCAPCGSRGPPCVRTPMEVVDRKSVV